MNDKQLAKLRAQKAEWREKVKDFSANAPEVGGPDLPPPPPPAPEPEPQSEEASEA